MNYLKRNYLIPINYKENANSIMVCDKCWNVVRLDIPQSGYRLMDISSTYNDFRVNHIKPDYECFCEQCQNFMFPCDEEFVDRIIDLNKFGVITEFCCEGHCTVTSSIKRGHYLIIDMPYLAINKDIEPELLDILKGLLSQQVYQFIQFEDDMEDMYVIRGSLYGEYAILESISDEDDKKNIECDFNTMKERYFDLIDDFIYSIRGE